MVYLGLWSPIDLVLPVLEEVYIIIFAEAKHSVNLGQKIVQLVYVYIFF